MRYALASGPIDVIRAYLPANYSATATDSGDALISGEDRAGWTLDGYVIPRLASGLYFAREIDSNDPAVTAARRAMFKELGWDVTE